MSRHGHLRHGRCVTPGRAEKSGDAATVNSRTYCLILVDRFGLAMERIRATGEEKAKIHEGNARRMLRLRLAGVAADRTPVVFLVGGSGSFPSELVTGD